MNIQLLPGTSLVELESEASSLEKYGLALPDSVRNRPVKIGRVVDSVMTGKDRAFLGVDSLQGSRVLIDGKNGTWIKDRIYRLRNLMELPKQRKTDKTRYSTPFLAIMPEGEITLGNGEAKRCMFCGPAKSHISDASPLLVDGENGQEYCPRCRKKADGSLYEPEFP